MPNRILNDIKQKEKDAEILPSYLNEEILYYEQLEQILPPDEFDRRLMSARLLKAYEGQTSDVGGVGADEDDEGGESDDDDE